MKQWTTIIDKNGKAHEATDIIEAAVEHMRQQAACGIRQGVTQARIAEACFCSAEHIRHVLDASGNGPSPRLVRLICDYLIDADAEQKG